jgi:predicted transcriptional regulator
VPAKLNPEQLERAIELQRLGWIQRRIAVELGVTQPAVSKSLARFNARVFERLIRRAAAEKARQIQVLERVTQEALEGWERSKRDAEILRSIEGGKDGPRTELVIKGQAGDPRMLAEARNALADARKILGLDAPAKLITSTTGERGPCTLDDNDPRFLADGGQPTVAGDDHPDAAEGPADRGRGGDGEDVRDPEVDPLPGAGQPGVANPDRPEDASCPD